MPKYFDDDFDLDESSPAYPELESFFDEGLIKKVLYTVKSGKEATVYCCEGGEKTGLELIAAKIYRARNNRTFKNDSMYQEGRLIMRRETRETRALKKGSKIGREVQAGVWIGHEYETLKVLHKAGADIPKPIAIATSAILLEFLGDEQSAAPTAQNVDFEPHEAQSSFDLIMRNIKLWLSCNYVHGDLSAYNILHWNGITKIIDFPQAVDPRFNSQALMLLTRDIDNVCRHWAKFGVQADAGRITRDLWSRFQRSQL